ncbi:ATP12 family chaperone protein [Rubellimicrobium sp. CFH 75288]|uniref:ATP12 family chaperone protein n=1 Tax=Rubellimicrobium sp. CFH 75288 TaxID=2697034 RepID=UPI001412061F|nr:ATP12 family protein [Rubellimicrobium sp. CFH 75288]NAZ35864.1 ATPase [Rubellimicrobium sp. CFH 75288]
MSARPWAPRRFWTRVDVLDSEGLWTVALDGRQVRTPEGAVLRLPTRSFAEAVAAEWRAQGERVEPLSMPATRLANAAIDRVTPNRGPVAAALAAYAETDLLCHRADRPERLVRRQREGWDPILAWAAETLGADLCAVEGLMPARQPPADLGRLRGLVEEMPPFSLAAFHDLVTLTSSLLLGLAVAKGRLDAEEAWSLSRLDEEFQMEEWGRDEEADAAAAVRRAAFLDAARLWDLLQV